MDKRKKTSKEKKATQKRETLGRKALSHMIKAHQVAEQLEDDDLKNKTVKAVSDAKKHVKELKEHLENVKHYLRHTKFKQESNEVRDFLQKIYESVEVTLKEVEEHLRTRDVPAHSANSTVWNSGVNNLRHYAHHVALSCDYIIGKLTEFIDKNKKEFDARVRATPPGGRGPPRSPYGGGSP
jgi:type I site-specific restriction endonuclease